MQNIKTRGVFRLACMILAAAVVFSMSAQIGKTYAASKKSVYVLSKVYYDKKAKANLYESYSYNSKGLVKKLAYGKSGQIYWKYKYDKKNRLALSGRFVNDWMNNKYTYKNGKLVKFTGYYSEKFGGKKKLAGNKASFKYNSKKQIKSAKVSGKLPDLETGATKKTSFTIKYTYDKKGHVKKKYHPYPGDITTHYYTYDKKGNLIKDVTKHKEGNLVDEVTYECTYKNGRLVKRTETWGDGESTTQIFTYKKIKVPKKLVKTVKAQQWSFLNFDLNNYMPGFSYGGM